MSLYQDILAGVDPILDEVHGDTVTYRRKGQTVVVTAVVEAHSVEADPAKDIFDSWHGHVFSLVWADLVLAGVQVTPEAGDEIAEVQSDGSSKVYRVMPLPNKRVFEPIDAGERRILIYTKERRQENA